MALGVIRTSVIKEVKGGISNVIRQLLKAMLTGPQSAQTAGIALPIQQLPFYSKSHKAVLGVKGASGTKPCFECKNVVALGDDSNQCLAELDPSG